MPAYIYFVKDLYLRRNCRCAASPKGSAQGSFEAANTDVCEGIPSVILSLYPAAPLHYVACYPVIPTRYVYPIFATVRRPCLRQCYADIAARLAV